MASSLRAHAQPGPRRAWPLRVLWRDDRGATAVEFAFLALPFFGLLAAIMQTALLFLSAQILDAAVADSARLIQTGQAQNAAYDHARYRKAICDNLYGLFDCSKVMLKVTTISGTPSDPELPVNPATGNWIPAWNNPTDYAPGTGQTVVYVQVYYKWPVPLNVGGFFGIAGALPDSTQLLGSSYVFMNEPF